MLLPTFVKLNSSNYVGLVNTFLTEKDFVVNIVLFSSFYLFFFKQGVHIAWANHHNPVTDLFLFMYMSMSM